MEAALDRTWYYMGEVYVQSGLVPADDDVFGDSGHVIRLHLFRSY